MVRLYFRIVTYLILSVLSALSHADGTGNVKIVGTTDTAADMDVYFYTIGVETGADPSMEVGQSIIMVRLASPNHQVEILTGFDPSTGAETWTYVTDGSDQWMLIEVSGNQSFRVSNIAAVNNSTLEYELYLSNPPHTSIGGSIASSDGVDAYSYGIEARTSITFSGTMVDQYHAPVPLSPQVISLRHATDVIIDEIEANESGWYSHTVTFPACNGGGIIFGAQLGFFPGFLDTSPWYSAWPMLANAPSDVDPLGQRPDGSTGSGAYGFNQDCN